MFLRIGHFIGKILGKYKKEAKNQYFDDFRTLDVIFCGNFVPQAQGAVARQLLKKFGTKKISCLAGGTPERRQKWPFLTIFEPDGWKFDP